MMKAQAESSSERSLQLTSKSGSLLHRLEEMTSTAALPAKALWRLVSIFSENKT